MPMFETFHPCTGARIPMCSVSEIIAWAKHNNLTYVDIVLGNEEPRPFHEFTVHRVDGEPLKEVSKAILRRLCQTTHFTMNGESLGEDVPSGHYSPATLVAIRDAILRER